MRFEQAATFSFQTQDIHNSNVKHCIQSLFPGFKPLYAIEIILVSLPNWHFHFGKLSSGGSKSTPIKMTHFGGKKVLKLKIFCGLDDSPALKPAAQYEMCQH